MSLPEGAIEIADPNDILRALMPGHKRENGTVDGTGAHLHAAKTDARKDHANLETSQAEKEEINAYFAANGPNESSASFSHNSEAGKPLGKHKLRRGSPRSRDEVFRKSKQKNTPDVSGTPANLGLAAPEFVDSRSRSETWIDDCIKRRPSFDRLETFAEGSILEYIDLLGVSRESVFQEFPASVPNLPLIPSGYAGTTNWRWLMDKVVGDIGGYGLLVDPTVDTSSAPFEDTKQEDDAQSRGGSQDSTYSKDDARASKTNAANEREGIGNLPFSIDQEQAQRLAEALNLECRRADLLQFQVRMLRSELVTALKRLDIALETLLPAQVCNCQRDSEIERQQETLMTENLDGLIALHSGTFVKQEELQTRGLDCLRSRRRQDTRIGSENGDDSPSTASIDTSDIWSSDSEDEDF